MQLKLLQWNVWFKENIERVIDVLKAQDADVICLQELTRGYMEQSRENTWEYIAHELGYAFRVQEIPIITEDAQWSQANAIFSRLPITGHRLAWVHEPDDAESMTDQYRGYLEVQIDAGGQTLTAATTHMSFTTPTDDDAEARRLLGLIPVHPERFILTGDLNAVPDSHRVAAIAERLKHAGPAYDVKTWTTKPFMFGDFAASTLDWRYDYVFVSDDVQVRAAAAVQTDVSDHLPIVVTLQLPSDHS